MYFAKTAHVNIDPTELMQNLITLYFDHNYESIDKLLKIDKSKYPSNDALLNKYYNKGMIFCDDDNPLTQIRIYVDEEIKYPLNTLLMVSSNSIDEKGFIDLIVNIWIKNVNLTGLLETDYIPKIVGKETYIQLKVGKKSWNDLTITCKNKGILLKTGFKMLVLSYLDEICYIE